MKYRAVNFDGIPFGNGKEPYVADAIEDLAYYIAYYWHRCSVALQMLDSEGKWAIAPYDLQNAFHKELDFRFSSFEHK